MVGESSGGIQVWSSVLFSFFSCVCVYKCGVCICNVCIVVCMCGVYCGVCIVVCVLWCVYVWCVYVCEFIHVYGGLRLILGIFLALSSTF